MKTNLTKKDKGLIAGLIIFALLSGVAGEFLGWQIEIDSTDFWQALLPALASIYFIYRTNKIWGGEVQRFLKVIGTGLVMHALLWGPIVQWHISGAPSVSGLSSASVFVLLHGMSGVAFMMTAYGFYLFYRSTKEREK